jgi:NADH-ubiquinone oxidoreductase chain 5
MLRRYVLLDRHFFHLSTYALVKALFFMCAGVIIHEMNDSQDIRFMGNLSFEISFTSVWLCVSNFALCGMSSFRLQESL